MPKSLLGEHPDPSGCLICEFVVPAQTQIDEIDSYTLGLMLRDFEAGEGMVKLPCPIEKLLIRVEAAQRAQRSTPGKRPAAVAEPPLSCR